MKKTTSLLSALIFGLMVLAGASMALAGGGVSGNWAGKWTCPDGQIKNGPMHGNLNQNGKNVTGHWTLVKTIEGNISGELKGTAADGIFIGNLNAQGVTIHMDGNFSDNAINGNYSSPIGNGEFHLKRK